MQINILLTGLIKIYSFYQKLLYTENININIKGGMEVKKIIAVIFVLLLTVANTYAAGISVALNGENIEFSSQQPFITGNRVFIPLREVFEKLGYDIGWDNETKTATLVSDNKTMEVSADKNHVTIDKNNAVALDLPAQIIEGTMMIPLRAVGTAAGIDMEWDHVNRIVLLRSQPDVYISNDTMMYGRAYEFLFKCLSVVDYADALYLSRLSELNTAEDNENMNAVFENMYNEIEDYRDIIYDFIPTDRSEEGLKEITLRYIDNEKKFIELYKSEIFDKVSLSDNKTEYDALEAEYRELETLFEEAVSSYHYRIDKYIQDNFNTENLDNEKKVALENYITRIAEADHEQIPIITRLDVDVKDILEKPAEYIEKLRKSEKDRNAAFSSVELPEGFEKRLEILFYANSMLEKMAEALEAYNDGTISYNRAETLIFLYGELYDDFNEEGANGRLVHIVKENYEVPKA